MKNLFLISIIVILFSSCSSSPEKKCQSLIRENLLGRMNDPKSYESVSFGKIDTVMSQCPTTLYDSSQYYLREANRLLDESDFVSTPEQGLKLCHESIKLQDKSKKLLIQYEEQEKNFISKPESLKMEHTARGTNKFGGMITKTEVYVIDFEMTKILRVVEK